MDGIHGGDIYRNLVELDFSVNVNPLGMQDEIRTALHEAVEEGNNYPDIRAEKLNRAVSKMLLVKSEYLLFGNGASELFMAIVHGIQPKKTLIPVPSFYGYEYAANAVKGEILYYEMKKCEGFSLGEEFLEVLQEDVDLLFLANPNNPTGNLMSPTYVKKLLCHCRRKGIVVVLDECFIEFCGEEYSLLQEIEEFDNLILVRAFTKIFAIPGVRLGYLLCGNQKLFDRIRRQLPEWNLSVFAQAAGCVCARYQDFIKETAEYVKKEREFLTESLKQRGFLVFSSEANFILVYTKELLYEKLSDRGILIRDCSNFRGLSRGFYRIAVKTRAENEQLLEKMR